MDEAPQQGVDDALAQLRSLPDRVVRGAVVWTVASTVLVLVLFGGVGSDGWGWSLALAACTAPAWWRRTGPRLLAATTATLALVGIGQLFAVLGLVGFNVGLVDRGWRWWAARY